MLNSKHGKYIERGGKAKSKPVNFGAAIFLSFLI